MQGALNFSFGSDLPFFYIFLGISIALALGSLALERCKLGYDLVALREQEEGAQALGWMSPRSSGWRSSSAPR